VVCGANPQARFSFLIQLPNGQCRHACNDSIASIARKPLKGYGVPPGRFPGNVPDMGHSWVREKGRATSQQEVALEKKRLKKLLHEEI
jgi:hypothetical protein